MYFKEGDLVLRKHFPLADSCGKFKPNFEDMHVITKVLSTEALHLSEIDGDSPHDIVNSNFVT